MAPSLSKSQAVFVALEGISCVKLKYHLHSLGQAGPLPQGGKRGSRNSSHSLKTSPSTVSLSAGYAHCDP